MEFTAELAFDNLTEEELGALIYLGSLPPEHCLTVAGGRPLGFGAVRVEIENAEIVRAEDRVAALRDLDASLQPVSHDQRPALDAFTAKMCSLYGAGYLQDFEKSAAGFSGFPVHYPRTTREPNPQGENFQWFVDNESTSNARPGHQLTLKDASDMTALPMRPIGR